MLPIALIFAGLLAAPPTADEAVIRARTQALIEAFKAVPADAKDTSAAFATLDGFFNREVLLKSALGPHASKLNAAQRIRFDADFWGLLRMAAYQDSGGFFKTATIKITAVTPAAAPDKPGVLVLNALVVKDDRETDITYHWGVGPAKTPQALQLIDVAFDGASLTLDYQNQFGRMIAKDGVGGLLDALSARLAKQRAAKQSAAKQPTAPAK